MQLSYSTRLSYLELEVGLPVLCAPEIRKIFTVPRIQDVNIAVYREALGPANWT
jgi:hypothetical protein